jgi:HAMP domain-containing protein
MFMSYRATSRALRDQESRQMQQRSAAVVESLKAQGLVLLDQARSFGPWTTFGHAIDAADVPWLEANVTTWMHDNTAIKSAQVLTPNGTVVSSAGDFRSASLQKLRVVADARRSGKASFGFQRFDGQLYLVAAAPVTRDDGRGPVHGIVVFGDRVDHAMLLAGVKTSGVSGLALHVGGIRVAQAPGQAPQSSEPRTLPVPGTIFTEHGSPATVAALRDPGGSPAGLLVVSADSGATTVTTATLRRTSGYALVAALLMALALAVLMAGAIRRPLRTLAHAATAIADGDTRQHIDVQSSDELGAVAEAFNTMSARITNQLDGMARKIRDLSVEMSSLTAFGETLAQMPDARAEMRRLTEMVREVYAAGCVVLYLYEDGELRLAASAGDGDDLSDDIERLCKQAANSREPAAAGIEAGTGALVLRQEVGAGALALAMPLVMKSAVAGVIAVRSSGGDDLREDDLSLLAAIGSQITFALQNAEAYQQLDDMYLETVTALATAMEAKDQYTAAHADTLSKMAVGVGRRLGLSATELRQLQYAAVLHDIGKIGIPGSVLNKPGKLDDEEFALMAQHTIIGEHIISRIQYLQPISRIVRSAHERWDGAGYPDGLSGEDIPLASRILLVCDAYHAMTSDRPYRKALPAASAMEELRDNAGSQFDPEMVHAFLLEFAPRELADAREPQRR